MLAVTAIEAGHTEGAGCYRLPVRIGEVADWKEGRKLSPHVHLFIAGVVADSAIR